MLSLTLSIPDFWAGFVAGAFVVIVLGTVLVYRLGKSQ